MIARVSFDADDLDRLAYSKLEDVALHEIAHALGFGIIWDDFLVNPSVIGGEPVSPLPDTHFAGANAVAAFDSADESSYQGGKVPVENQFGGTGGQDSHWRKSVMGRELMTYTIGGSASFNAITIQSMADLGYTVDTTLAEPYTVPNLSGDPLSLAAETEELPLNCIVHPLTDIDYVTEPLRNTLPASRLDPQIIEVMIE